MSILISNILIKIKNSANLVNLENLANLVGILIQTYKN